MTARSWLADPVVENPDDDTSCAGGVAEPASEMCSDRVLVRAREFGRYITINELEHRDSFRMLHAYDHTLQREVALKVLTGRLSSEGQEQMLREAQAMAKLSHPNVLAIYGAEVTCTSEGNVAFLAMEHVRGTTLRMWLQRARPWREILAAFVAAGQGLAAAHEVGLLHRTFSPDNVLVGEDGRVRVTNFGLALTGEHPAYAGSAANDGAPDDAAALAYLAPEVHEQSPLQATADQYAFCVALWESLAGRLPFAVDHVSQWAEVKRREPPTWPRRASVSKPVVRALLRGLEPQASERWPSMRALLGVLSQQEHARRRVWQVVAAVVVLGVSGTAAGAWYESRARRCSGGLAQIEGVWEPSVRQAVSAAMRGTNLPYALATHERAQQQLDAFATRWTQMHTEACEATTLRREQPAQVMDLRMACLQRAKAGLGAVLGVLAKADAEVVEKAHHVLATLPSIDRCADVEALQAEVAPPEPSIAADVERVYAELAKVEALREAGKYAQAKALAEALQMQAEAIPYGPLMTAVWIQLGLALQRSFFYEEAERAMQAALRSALRWNQSKEAQTVASHLVYTAAALRRGALHVARGWAYAQTARALVKRGDTRAQATLTMTIGLAYQAQGRHPQAVARLHEAAAMFTTLLGADHLEVAQVRMSLVRSLTELGRYAEAEQEGSAALAAFQRILGPDHPDVGVVHMRLTYPLNQHGKLKESEVHSRAAVDVLERALGSEDPHVGTARSGLADVLLAQGRLEESEREARAALAIYERVLDPDSIDIMNCKNALGGALLRQGRHAEALALQREVVQSWERKLDKAHPHTAIVRSNYGKLLLAVGRAAEAEAEHRLAVRDLERVYGPDNFYVCATRTSLASALAAQGRLREAIGEYRTALASWEKIEQPDPHFVWETRQGLALALAARGETRAALPVLEQAWKTVEEATSSPRSRAQTAFALAQALWKTGGDRMRARQLAQTARLFYAQAQDSAQRLHAVDVWLRKNQAVADKRRAAGH